jgi:hypothetical protein
MRAAVRTFNMVDNENVSRDTPSQQQQQRPRPKLVNSLVSTLITNCLACNNGNYHLSSRGQRDSGAQFVELKGVRFIGLGAVCDELSPRERVFDTLEFFRTKTERLLSIGYILDKEGGGKTVETIPLEFWTRDFPDERSMSSICRKTIELVRVGCRRGAVFESICSSRFSSRVRLLLSEQTL